MRKRMNGPQPQLKITCWKQLQCCGDRVCVTTRYTVTYSHSRYNRRHKIFILRLYGIRVFLHEGLLTATVLFTSAAFEIYVFKNSGAMISELHEHFFDIFSVSTNSLRHEWILSFDEWKKIWVHDFRILLFVVGCRDFVFILM